MPIPEIGLPQSDEFNKSLNYIKGCLSASYFEHENGSFAMCLDSLKMIKKELDNLIERIKACDK